jgi:RimJ/RimL family protein N-acetyltransferase
LSELETDRLRLRAWRDDDLETLHRLNCDERVYRYLTGSPSTRAESEAQLARFRAHWAEHGFGICALEERASGRMVGRAGLAFHRLWPDDPELGWMLDPDVWGRGYATEAGAAALNWAFELGGFERVVSIVHPENGRSIRVQDRLGLGPWRDVPWDETGIVLQVRSLSRAEWNRARGVAAKPR